MAHMGMGPELVIAQDALAVVAVEEVVVVAHFASIGGGSGTRTWTVWHPGHSHLRNVP